MFEQLMGQKEKEKFLNDAVNGDFTLFLEHDPVHECCTVERTERGFKVKETFLLVVLQVFILIKFKKNYVDKKSSNSCK
mgnify:CR=1 FL=1